MKKLYNAIGLMSGTSSDGVDCSIIQSDGDTKYSVICDMYFAYNSNLRKKLTILRDKINSINFKNGNRSNSFLWK